MRYVVLLFLVAVIALAGYGWLADFDSTGSSDLQSVSQSGFTPVRLDSGPFFKASPRHFKGPQVQEVLLPKVGSSDVSWGAVGRDRSGNIYVGLSESYGDPRSASMLRWQPDSQDIESLGNVMQALKHHQLAQQLASQGKIHSQFVTASDGLVYFTSFDEEGESDTHLPTWGGHLWRFDPIAKHWEHLLQTPEALIAINTDGHYIYALGYWGHVLYQFDTLTGRVNKTEVGAVPGHVSRQILVDGEGHVYVPKLSPAGNEQGFVPMLAELDHNLNVVHEFALPEYLDKNMSSYRGIVGYTTMKNGDVFFTLHKGQLFHLRAEGSKDEKLQKIGFFNPAGEANIPSLFSIDGEQFVMGASRRRGSVPEWLIYETVSGTTVSYPMPELDGFLFFGTQVKDESGAMYLVGQHISTRSPKVVRLTFPE